MKKKIFSALLIAAMTTSLFAGCGSDKGGNDGGTQQAGAASSEETYHMVMQVTTYGFDDPDMGIVQDAVNEITVPEIGVEVEFKSIPIGEQATKLGLMVSGGEQIDLVVPGLLTTPANLVADGLLTDITEYVEASEPLMKLADGIIDACKVDGKLYAYPGSTANGNYVAFMYDADMAEKYNIEVPAEMRTTDDWNKFFESFEAAKAAANGELDNVYAFTLGDGVACEYEWNDFDALGDAATQSYGVVMAGTPDKVVNLYATPEYLASAKTHHEWYEKGYVMPDSVSSGLSTFDCMQAGTVFAMPSNSGAGMNEAYWSKQTGKNLKAVPMTDVNTTADNVINFCWGVSSTCENPEKAVKFLELMYTNTELANLLNYGIEGTHYVTTEGSKIIDYPEGVDGGSSAYGNFVGTYGNNLEIYQRAPLDEAFVENLKNLAYPNANCSKYIGYTFDSSSVATQVTNVSAVVTKYSPSLTCGVVDPDTMIDEFISELEKAGINDIIEENQRQLDEYLANLK